LAESGGDLDSSFPDAGRRSSHEPDERPRLQREAALLPAMIKLRGQSIPCTTINLSAAGRG
jgi:hypothetical protein